MATNKKLTTEEFIKRADSIHNGVYSYDEVIYNGTKNKVLIRCLNHGGFWQTPAHHLKGHGCPKCGSKSAGKRMSYSFEDFKSKAQGKHPNKFLYYKDYYLNMQTEMPMFCFEHGIFWQKPYNHLRTHGCQKCGIQKMIEHANNRIYSSNEFSRLAKIIHDNKYDYIEKAYIKLEEELKLFCKDHGVFIQVAKDHLMGRGCSRCNKSQHDFNLIEDILSREVFNE